MLVHAIVLSALLSVSVSVVCYLLTGDLGRVVQCVGLAWAALSLWCFRAQWYITQAYVYGRIARAEYRPSPPVTRIIEHTPAIAPVTPVAKPVVPVERVRFIPMYSRQPQRSAQVESAPISPPPFLKNANAHGVDDVRDLKWFISGLDSKGSHSRRRWEGKVAPSGRVVDAEYHAELITPLVACSAITGRAERRAGSLVMSPSEILSVLNL